MAREVWEVAHEYQIVRDGDWYFDPVRVIGVFSAEAEAERVRMHAVTLPGFAETQNFEGENGVVVSMYRLDELHWTEGFARLES